MQRSREDTQETSKGKHDNDHAKEEEPMHRKNRFWAKTDNGPIDIVHHDYC